ncbi:unnamed protein product [Notodromas monacha]|uniref:BLOC-1-related complex subunit 7 n=1 Tax=Notodromas monacha TaxID=399045 RepID=A0A7R9GD61_9CRUS|nr:unnamed protein product [Notodromas monacha]CAG0916635.1 unnamed protein product [Notodromas monacha]
MSTVPSMSHPKQLYAESKDKLSQRIQQNINAIASVCREIHRGSKSEEVLADSAKNTLALEPFIESTSQGVEKLSAFATHLAFQVESIENSVQQFESVLELAEAVRGIEPKEESKWHSAPWNVCRYVFLMKTPELNDLFVTVGFNVVAVEKYIEEKEITFPGGRKQGSEKAKKDNLSDIPGPDSFLTSRKRNQRILSRLTYSISDPITSFKLSQSRNAKKYDIIAVRPTSLTGLQSACQTIDVDIIQLRIPCEFKWPRKMLLTAIRRGIAFELLYSPMLMESSKCKLTISVAHTLFTLTKSKNLILSSGAINGMQLRGPLDVCNLAELLGFSEHESRKCVTDNCRAVLLKALGRKTVKGVALVSPVTPEVSVIDDTPDSASTKNIQSSAAPRSVMKRRRTQSPHRKNTGDLSGDTFGVPKYKLSSMLLTIP